MTDTEPLSIVSGLVSGICRNRPRPTPSAPSGAGAASARRVARRACLAAGLFVAFAPSALRAEPDEMPRLSFAQLVDSIRANSEVTGTIKSYNGKQVAIQGFIVPAGPPDLSFFLLSRVSAMGNYCCEAPVGEDETVYAFAAKEVKIAYDPLRIYKVVGVFDAGMRSDATYGPSLFRLRDVRVEEAVGAKIFKVGEIPPPVSKP